MKKVFRVHCSFLVKAEDERTVETYLQEEPDFVEQHIIIDETEIINEEIYKTL